MSESSVNVEEHVVDEKIEMTTAKENVDVELEESSKIDNSVSPEKTAEHSAVNSSDIDPNVGDDAAPVSKAVENDFASIKANPVSVDSEPGDLDHRTNLEPDAISTTKENNVDHSETDANVDHVETDNSVNKLNDNNPDDEIDYSEINKGSEPCDEISDINLKQNSDADDVEKPSEEIHQNGPSLSPKNDDLNNGNKIDEIVKPSENEQICREEDDHAEEDAISEVEEDSIQNVDFDKLKDVALSNIDCDKKEVLENPLDSIEKDAPLNNSDLEIKDETSVMNVDCDMEENVNNSNSVNDKDVSMNDPDCDMEKISPSNNSDVDMEKDVQIRDDMETDVLLNNTDVDMDKDVDNPDCDIEKDRTVTIAECNMEDAPVEKSDEEKDVLVENFDCDKVTDTFEDKHCESEKDGLETNQACDEESISEDNQDCDMGENVPDEDENCDALSEANPICHADEDALDESQIGDDKSDEHLLEKSSNDIPHASDPFDDLLDNEKHENVSDTMDHTDSGIIENDIDNHLMDDDLAPVIDEAEAGHVADINHGQGADEEVCLLPDTEREITEADKLKALASKKTIDIDSTANAYDSLTKGTDDVTELKDEVMADTNDESHAEEIDGIDQTGDHGAEDDIEDESLREVPEKENEEEHVTDDSIDAGIIQEIVKMEQTCLNCSETKDCVYRMLVENEMKYLCTINCVNVFQESQPDKYKITHRKVTVSEINPVFATCLQCEIEKKCYYRVTSGSEIKNICQEECLQLVINENLEKYKLRKKKKMITEIDKKDATCFICSKDSSCEYETMIEGENKYVCGYDCFVSLQTAQPNVFRLKRKKVMKPRQPMLKLKVISNAADKYLDEGNKIIAKTPAQAEAARIDRDKSFLRKCAHCNEPYVGNDKNLSWETMDFCNEICLGKYQNTHGLHCANCKNCVSMVSLGKYCVRFGYDIRQFCCSGCLDEFKKGLKICCYCQRDISADYEGFLAPVGDQGQFKDFCSQFCVEKFDQMSKNPVPPPVWAQCAVCSKEKPTQLEVAVGTKKPLRLCSEPCFAAFKFVNTVFPDQCRWCKKYFERKSAESYTIYTEASAHCFCSKTCMNVYISNSRHIVPCNWCKVKKYNFDMIKKTLENGQSMMMCSLNCLTLYQVSINAVSSRRIKCDQCKRFSQAQYHLTMSDATVRNFCTYQCVMSFQRQYTKSPMVADGDSQAVPTGAPRRTYNNQKMMKTTLKKSPGRPSGLPVISNVQSLASPPPLSNISQVTGHATRAKSKKLLQDKPKSPPSPPPEEPPKAVTPPPPPPPKIFNHIVFKPPPPKEVRNVSTLTKPLMVTKGVSCRPHPCSKEVQTDDHLQRRILIPIPVPIYVPAPMAMYSLPFPIPVPIPLPIPVPVFIPTTRNSANGIMKEIKKIHDKMPTDPFEAELLMMAEMVAGDKKKCESDSDSEDENGDDGFSPDAMDTGNSAFGEDVLQMALKMATEYEEPAVDLESAMTASTITPSSHPTLPAGMDENSPLHHHQLMLLEQQRAAAAAAAAANAVGRKRGAQGGASPVNATGSRSKRSRRNAEPPPPTHHAPPEPPREPQEKPDANMCLKYTFGVNAWKQWVMTKNAEMEKSTVRRKPFKSEILQLTADELNYSLCLFVKEVRKPNGSEYAPDTIYYLVLGIQQYLFENGRIDNIFTDSYYEKFTECLDEVARKFSVLYNDSQYIVTRVEEEHLWESKQLGAHSPHVLLSTLMFFNTKHFNLVTVEEHMQLSFSHIMKHWKRNPNQPGAAKIPGARNVLLRFYPPQAALEANSRKKKVYEQQENEDNPLRCPVKLYEFYISKCPESVKTRNDVFYLMPERSCVPDSPVWYSTQALGREPLSKMLHRVKMVKEINIALLTS